MRKYKRVKNSTMVDEFALPDTNPEFNKDLEKKREIKSEDDLDIIYDESNEDDVEILSDENKLNTSQ